ncbi:MAG: HAMP domain-containing sensor histidine kinase [Candidatus Gracilibacteria bacterium]|nr:HAMP domain-containing sensor histidine kinase [Candidatus Gracilibacteria bacterium]
MSLSRKFIIAIITTILFITTINILAFYVFYTTYLKVYLVEKNESRDKVTIEYINDIIKKQTIDDIDSIFTDTEIEFFELLENNDGKIPLSKEKNVDIVINYLVKSGIAPKYIEEIIPTDNFGKVLEAMRDKASPEYRFINKLRLSIIITNIISITISIIFLIIFIRKTIYPIKNITQNIKNIQAQKKYGKQFEEIIYYNKKDEVGLLVDAINSLNKRLNLQDEIRTRLLADISHELKTPITSIQCYLEGISDGVIKLDQKNLNSITYEMKRLITLVNKIMEYEKLDRKKLDLSLSDFQVNDLIISLVETHKKRLRENKQRIKVTGEIDVNIKADKDLFIQLVHNLIGNFLKYAGKKTFLKVNVTRKYIDFCDDGEGIKASEIPFLTEKFYQGNIEKTGDIDARGIGVGLSIVTKIIESHGWKYEIKSDIGKGFSFKIYI